MATSGYFAIENDNEIIKSTKQKTSQKLIRKNTFVVEGRKAFGNVTNNMQSINQSHKNSIFPTKKIQPAIIKKTEVKDSIPIQIEQDDKYPPIEYLPQNYIDDDEMSLAEFKLSADELYGIFKPPQEARYKFSDENDYFEDNLQLDNNKMGEMESEVLSLDDSSIIDERVSPVPILF